MYHVSKKVAFYIFLLSFSILIISSFFVFNVNKSMYFLDVIFEPPKFSGVQKQLTLDFMLNSSHSSSAQSDLAVLLRAMFGKKGRWSKTSGIYSVDLPRNSNYVTVRIVAPSKTEAKIFYKSMTRDIVEIYSSALQELSDSSKEMLQKIDKEILSLNENKKNILQLKDKVGYSENFFNLIRDLDSKIGTLSTRRIAFVDNISSRNIHNLKTIYTSSPFIKGPSLYILFLSSFFISLFLSFFCFLYSHTLKR